MIWRLQESKFGMNKWEANRLWRHFNINKLHLIWIQELESISNVKWDVFSLPDPHNKEKKWDLLPHHSRFPLEYVKLHVRSIQNSLRLISIFPLIETIWNKWSGALFEFNLIYLQGYSFSCGQCTFTWVCILLVFFPTH